MMIGLLQYVLVVSFSLSQPFILLSMPLIHLNYTAQLALGYRINTLVKLKQEKPNSLPYLKQNKTKIPFLFYEYL